MKQANLIDRLLLSNPIHRATVEYVLLIGTGILGLIFSWPKIPFFPLSNIAGGVLFVGGFLFHAYAERNHKQAHEKSADIVQIVKSGVFSKIRHPLYLSVITMNIGIALASGVVATFVIALITVFHWIISALKEEAFLIQKFGDEYKRYKEQVRWRFLPGIF
jgi:protein-S-isoprenylcysteine O-methyltransferase Ste14